MTAPVVVFAVGNPSRGDDALGPLLCARLEAWLETAGLADGFTLIEDFQLQIEHALDLVGCQLALFIDAGERTPGPFIFAPIAASTASSPTSHALAPEAVLQVYRQTEGEAPPPAFVLCVRGEGFELGAPLSPVAQASGDAAFAFLTGLCRTASPAAWRLQASGSEFVDMHHGQPAPNAA